MTELLISKLLKHGIAIMDMRGQGYDNGVNMRGEFFLTPSKRFIHFYPDLHTAGALLKEHVKDGLTVKPLITTRWESRVEAVKPLITTRWESLLEAVKPLITTRWESRVEAVKPLITTRWESRVEAVKPLITTRWESRVEAVKPLSATRWESRVEAVKPLITTRLESRVEAVKPLITMRWESRVEDVKPLITTRWESRVEAVKPVRYQLGEIYDALLSIATDTKLTGSCGAKTRLGENSIAAKTNNFGLHVRSGRLV
ncbi:uncharacterized protein LOC109895180 [Oncorhynchus kisutch]|uniref:uncharacterized protein LOC109895180 n=1 Tax=Oncorhynchus kisutch TaxID=8019 RepID=UPI0012DBDA73|nr:uncharacterized protein LOC109895180 [Oncorhynchus kisutch]